MLKVTDLEKNYEGKPLLCGVSFTLAANETVSLLGRSGGGKSTILRIIAGLEEAESGTVIWDGQDFTHVPAYRRGFGLMFQDYALFPHLNVFDNVAFGLHVQKLSPEKLQERVSEVLAMVGMASFSDRSVFDLSGGEKQRIAFARAIAPWPKMLMLDEPMGALDRTLRDQLLNDLQQLLDVADIPVIYVTHDQEEAFAVADRILILQDGCITQSGTPREVYSCPKNIWIASFLGLNNQMDGKIVSLNPFAVADRILILQDGCITQSGTPREVYSCPKNIWIASFLGLNNQMDGKVVSLNPFTVETPIGTIQIDSSASTMRIGDLLDLLAMDVCIDQFGIENQNSFPARVTAQRFLGHDYQISLLIAEKWKAVITTEIFRPVGELVSVSIPPVSILPYPKGERHEDC